MMLRIIFTGLATCMLLLAAGVRFAREDAPQSVRKELGSALERAVESAKQALPRLPQRRLQIVIDAPSWFDQICFYDLQLPTRRQSPPSERTG